MPLPYQEARPCLVAPEPPAQSFRSKGSAVLIKQVVFGNYEALPAPNSASNSSPAKTLDNQVLPSHEQAPGPWRGSRGWETPPPLPCIPGRCRFSLAVPRMHVGKGGLSQFPVKWCHWALSSQMPHLLSGENAQALTTSWCRPPGCTGQDSNRRWCSLPDWDSLRHVTFIILVGTRLLTWWPLPADPCPGSLLPD